MFLTERPSIPAGNLPKALILLATWILILSTLATCGSTPAPVRTDDDVQTPAVTQSVQTTQSQGKVGVGSQAGIPSAAVTLRIGTTYIWDTPNPVTGWHNYTLRYLLYDTLIEQVGIHDFVPGLAKDWKVSDDGLVWIFKIRDGVVFHDGTSCDAEGIAWSLNWTIENKPDVFGPYLGRFQSIVATDSGDVQITLSEPASNMESLLANVWILPRSIWEGMAPEEVQAFTGLSAGVGTGPYRLVEWIEGEYLVLKANQVYWRGSPALDFVVWQSYPTEDAVAEALLDGEIDVIGAGVISPEASETLKGVENISLVVMPSTTIDELIVNSYQRGTQPASLKDPKVRLAIAYGIDKQRIIDEVYLGYADSATVVVPPAMGDWHSGSVEDVPFDPEEGARILEEAGYKDVNADGIREDKKGTPLKYRLYSANDPVPVRILEIISDGLAQMGISAPPIPMTEEGLLGVYPEFDFDLMYWGWGLGTDPDFALRVFTCSERQKGGWNDSGYCDQDFDAMYREQSVTLVPDTRRQLIWDMQTKLFEDRPYIVLTYPHELQAYRSDRFTGFAPDAGDLLWKASLRDVRPIR